MKKILMGLGGIIVLLAIIFGLFVSNLDSIIQAAIEKYGSEATQTEVALSDIELSPTSGVGRLSGLTIANPEGFAEEHAFSLGMVEVQVDTETMAGEGPAVIKKIVIDKPQISFEINENGAANLKTISRNAQSYAQGDVDQVADEEPASDEVASAEKKLIIKELTVSGAHVSMAHALFKGKKLEADIPSFTLRNLGEGEGGMTPAQLAQTLISTITQKASDAASKAFINGLGFAKDASQQAMDAGVKKGQEALDKGQDALNKAGDQMKSLMKF